MNVTLQFSIVLLLLIVFSVDPVTSLVADRIYKPNYSDFIIFEGRNKKDRGKKNHNESMKKNILLVDDEPNLTFSIKEQLVNAGFNVDIFNDSMYALENFEPDFYDLVILDIVMTEMDGFELYKELEKLDPRINVCFLTASELYRDEQREVKYRDLNQNLFIQKPISSEDLKREINKRIGTTE